MAEIVLGLGTSHGPMLSTPPDKWNLRVPDDERTTHHYRGRTWSFEQLVEERRGENLAAQLKPEVWRERHAACRKAIDVLADVFHDAKPDIAVIVGNDQMEIFNDDLLPAFSILWGDKIVNSMYSDERISRMPPGIPISVPGHIPIGGATYKAVPELGRHLIEQAIRDEFDVASMKNFPREETPHAFGFVYRQVMRDDPVPSVPVVLNTFYPPNQPTVTRCYDFGKSLLRGIRDWESDAKVAVIATGGLTHFVIDEEVDKVFLDALEKRKVDSVAALGENIFQAGTSEIKNWVPVAGCMAALDFKPTLVDYVPCYRSLAGTGNAMAFVHWRP